MTSHKHKHGARIYSRSVKMTFNKRRFADLTNEEVKKIVEDKDSLNTKKSTKQAVGLFRKYLFEKEIEVEFKYFDKEILDQTLCKFYAEARIEDGSLLKKSSLHIIRHGLNRHLNETSEIDIIRDLAFKE